MKGLRSFGWPFVSLSIGLFIAMILSAVLGESPFQVLKILVLGAFGSKTQLGYSLYYATPLIFTGLSVAWAFRAGLFNIGAEGQMTLGGVAMAAAGILWPDAPSWTGLPLALSFGFLVGGFWGALAGWIKARRGCHEVLATILLNFVAYGLASFLILSVFKNPTSQVPETAAIGSGYELSSLEWLGGGSPLSSALYLALAMVLAYAFIFARTKLGFYQRLAGGSPEAGRRAGIAMDRQTIMAMFFSGGLAALAAAGPVLGFSHKTREGFTSGVGFVGIAVALLGRNSALGITAAALLFGMLTKGALDLDLDTKFVSRDLATVIEALIVLAVASQVGMSAAGNSLWAKWANRKKGEAK